MISLIVDHSVLIFDWLVDSDVYKLIIIISQEEYEQEGICATQIGYKDNRPLLDLLLKVNEMGLMDG